MDSERELMTGWEDLDSDDQAVQHYGTPRHSGRYPWGSGDNPYQRDATFLSRYRELKKGGASEQEIVKYFGMKNSSELRANITAADHKDRAYKQALAAKLTEKGLTKAQIARRMNLPYSTVTSLLNPAVKENQQKTEVNAKILKDDVDRYDYIDIGGGAEHHLGITRHRLNAAVRMLCDEEGYVTINVPVPTGRPGKTTTMTVLAKPGTTFKDAVRNRDRVRLPNDAYSEDGGKTIQPIERPVSVDSSRLMVKFGDEGGKDKDGLVELRRGVEDISLKNAKYAQVRIAVDGTHYIKGMAVHSDDLPPGVDIVFNTNKTRAECHGDKMAALKPLKDDPDNPFGASIQMFDDQLIRAQRHYVDKDGKTKLSALNIVSEEGDWMKWKQRLSSQFLSKQAPSLAKKQLDLKREMVQDEYKEIMSLTNPTVRAKMLEDFARQCDADASDLYAASLPRQASKVILPVPKLKPDEIYAPGYKDGELVACVRFPYAGPFESPVLRVNNRNSVAKKMIGEAIDAVGIHPKAASQLSGADFDGDTVLVIPMAQTKVRTAKPLEGLKDFDPGALYPAYEGMPVLTERQKQQEMGRVSNLITDMTIKGAPPQDIVRAVRHSMVIIDAVKHKYNWKLSEEMEDIRGLKAKWQGGERSGASTIISKAGAEDHILEQREKAPSRLTPEERKLYDEGKQIFEKTGRKYKKWHPAEEAQEAYVDENGKKHRAKPAKEGYNSEENAVQTVTKMFRAKDAYELVSGSPNSTTKIEAIYADFANSMKRMADECRKQARATQDLPYNKMAAETYAKEVESLKAKLRIAEANQPLERKALAMAQKVMSTLLYNNPMLKQDKDKIRKLRAKELDNARRRLGAKKLSIGDEENPLTAREWEAINSGALHKTVIRAILKNSNTARIRQLATPRTARGMSTAKIATAKSMLKRGYTQEEVASMMDVSVSTLIRAIGIADFDT